MTGGPATAGQNNSNPEKPIRFAVIGGLTIDDVVNAAGEIALHQCGGNGLYAAVGARIWSEGIGVVARIGEDYPRSWVEGLAGGGIDVQGVREVSGPHLLRGGMKYDNRGDRTEFVAHTDLSAEAPAQAVPSAYMHASRETVAVSRAQVDFAPEPEDVPPAYLAAQAFHLSPRIYDKHMRSLALLSQHAKWVSLDPAVWYMRERNESKLSALFGNVAAMLPSEVEAAAFAGSQDPEEAARKLGQLGPQMVAIKLGAAGSLVYDCRSGRTSRVPVYPARVKDPTGAGDSFCGGFMVGYAETQDAVAAAMYGTVSASFVVEGFGGLYALQFSRRDAEERLSVVRERWEAAGRSCHS